MSNTVVHPTGEIQINGRFLNLDGEVSIQGERGRFKYIGFSTTSEGRVVLNFVGGPIGHEMMRSFYPERVKTVHNLRTAGRRRWIMKGK